VTNLLRKVRVTTPELKMLEYIADRGGEIPWDWSKCAPPAKAMIANMINNELVIEREYVTHAAQLVGELKLRLTDQGRAVLAQIQAVTVKAKPAEIVSG
jgi:hypothetical protein